MKAKGIIGFQEKHKPRQTLAGSNGGIYKVADACLYTHTQPKHGTPKIRKLDFVKFDQTLITFKPK